MSPDNDRRPHVPFDENDDGLDLPTYDPRSAETPVDTPRRRPRRIDPYARTGRAAPQSIPPRGGDSDAHRGRLDLRGERDDTSTNHVERTKDEVGESLARPVTHPGGDSGADIQPAPKNSGAAFERNVDNSDSDRGRRPDRAAGPYRVRIIEESDPVAVGESAPFGGEETPGDEGTRSGEKSRPAETAQKSAKAAEGEHPRKDEGTRKPDPAWGSQDAQEATTVMSSAARARPLASDAPTEPASTEEASSRQAAAPNGQAAGSSAPGSPGANGRGEKTRQRAGDEGLFGRREPQVIAPAETEILPAMQAVIGSDPSLAGHGSAASSASGPQPAPATETAVIGGVAGAGARPTQGNTATEEDLEAADLDAEFNDTAQTRRGTLDLGLLLARLAIGVFLVLHSVGVFFHLGASEGLAGLSGEFAGYPWGGILSIAVPAAELAAGVFLVLGLMTPVFAAVGLVATGFGALHALTQSAAGLNAFEWPAQVWLAVLVFGAVAALQFTGPGTWSIDYPRGWARRPLASSWIGSVVGVAVLGLVWWFGAATNPF